ncbi:MAG: serine/threonine-protein phosphatase [Leptospiraceae bacterium]|nr:serine/threonine-protein phosphatase [Leptospiraceae bacterium]
MESVGGDFIDFRTIKGNPGLIMADVSGHGIPASLVVSSIKTAFLFQEESMIEPRTLLSNLNHALLDKTGKEFVTACYTWIDLKNKIIKTRIAGHNALVVYRNSNNQIYEIKPKGPPLCLFDNSKFDSIEFNIEKGDRILLYTDGLFEVINSEN